MGEKKFSQEQLSAIETRDRTLLVSAAAGSGKTTTLTERIIRGLLDEKSPASINNMLIVTFTNAAVGDLKDKISRALKEAVETTHSKRLERELFSLPTAHISTIDSFCAEVVRENAEKLGVPPNYRLASEAEATVLASTLLNLTVDMAYEGLIEGVTPFAMEALSDTLTSSKKNSALADVLRMLYERSKSAIDGVAIYRNLANEYLQKEAFSVENTFFGKEIMNHTKEVLSYHGKELLTLIDSISDDPMYSAECAVYYETAEKLLGALEISSYEEMRSFLQGMSYPDLPKIPKLYKTPSLEFARARRTKIKGSLSDLYRKFFLYPTVEWYPLYEGLYYVLSTLSTLLESFDRTFTAEKIRRAMLEHSDVERLAYTCLYKNGEASEVALAYRDRFDAVYIDEYQDVNELQDAIFLAVSRRDNRFMVGDIKQSIYSFRSARPEIFAQMKDSFPPLENSEAGEGASLFMSRNYRCNEGIVDFVNDVFAPIFSTLGGAVSYREEDALKYSKISDTEPPYVYPELEIFSKKPSSDDPERDLAAPRRVAKKIASLLNGGTLDDGSPIRPSDIAIIMRKNASVASYASALAELGIKADTGPDKSFFLNSEVLLALCLLNAIDNPSKDVYLAGLMCSPLYGFTADELLFIRKEKRGGSLYSALKAYGEAHPENKRVSEFIESLLHYRTVSEGMNVDALILRLYKETGLLALASKHGGKENLMLLYSFARSYEGSSYRGLYNFIKYLDTVIELGTSFAEKRDGTDSDAVKITTVHSSKGLEYPIVFFADAGKSFHNRDTQEKIVYAEDYGISVCLRMEDNPALVSNPVQNIIIEKMEERYFEEELRVLYVALTRARERLYVSGESPKSEIEEYVANASFEGKLLSSFSKHRLTSYLDVILAANTKAPVITSNDGDSAQTELEHPPCEEITNEEEPQATEKDNVEKILLERFGYRYPDVAKAKLPEKMSVSRLYPTVLDGEEDVPLIIKDTDQDKPPRLPSFISGDDGRESAKRGIATHTFLQFFSIESLEKLGAEGELRRLVKEGYVSEEDSKRVRMPEIEKFCHSRLLSEMKSAKRLLREFRFTSRLPATLLTLDPETREAVKDEKILVQGVIDCIIEDENGDLAVIDYKTDRLTAEELSDRSLAEKKLNLAHSLQLSYYAEAVKIIFGRSPKRIEVYSLPLGDTVKITPSI